MAPSLFNFRELRRRSKASFRTEHSVDTASDLGGSGATTTEGSLTPPSVSSTSDPSLPALLHDVKDTLSAPSTPRPPPTATPSLYRRSVASVNGLGYSPMNGGSVTPASPYAPKVTNVHENAWVYQKAMLVNGTIGDPSQQAIDGTLTVSRLDDGFPPITWPVCSSHFKALIYLQPGPNRIRFEFSNPKLSRQSSAAPHASYLTLHMLPPTNTPPLQLAILVAKDSPETFDAMPARAEREGNDLDLAIRKFRMAAYLWQAFTAEQMWRNKLGRRTFRFEEEWALGSSNYRDAELGTLRSEARVHVIRTDKTVEELRQLERAAHQCGDSAAGESDPLFDIAAEAAQNYFRPLPGQKQYVSVIVLDSHWDPEAKTVRAHTARGGSRGDLQLAMFGSHCLQSYPASFEEIAPAFTDCTPTDTQYVANEGNQAGTSWEAANLGIGAHLHSVGHLFGMPHQEVGIMQEDYLLLNRTFVAREAYSTRTKSKGGPVLPEDECKWHRLDCLRFRSHPCFKLPNDPVLHPDTSVQGFPVEGSQAVAMAATGISFLEIVAEGDEVCRAWIEYPVENNTPQRQVILNEQDLRSKLPGKPRKGGKLRVHVRSYGGGSLDIPDLKQMCSKASTLKLGGGKVAYRGKMITGPMRREGAGREKCEIVFMGDAKQNNRVLSRIMAYHGQSLDGLEFVYDDGSTQLFGAKPGGDGSRADVFEVDIRRGEYLTGFQLRVGSGPGIEGIQFLTSVGRKSPAYGSRQGGSPYMVIPPRGYDVVGVGGTYGEGIDGFSLIISK
ncbi:related to jacalin-like lectin domain-containing protein [Cephalotrichum gorgonifer]|uniref:Related to jacalin-like lectin domain-containing protein n=1 Tax=Cephalotrichum gorgonifer TaxID=2041049 RepID=A0AAE8SUT4_9PEZI|nr:related to jacalin-like lectin domain-containing protein [Cephalotrichum gorgonifer]